jgi:hypothetical protein
VGQIVALQADDAIAAPQKMSGLFLGHFVAECVYTVAALGIADLLAHGPSTILEAVSKDRAMGGGGKFGLGRIASVGEDLGFDRCGWPTPKRRLRAN